MGATSFFFQKVLNNTKINMTATVEKTRKHAQQKRTQKRIMDAAVGLFQELGCNATTVTAIIEAAGISRNTFYRYFKDADDILNQVIVREVESITNRFLTERTLYDDIRTQMVEDFVLTLSHMRGSPIIAMMHGPLAFEILPRLKFAMAELYNFSKKMDANLSFDKAKQDSLLREDVDLDNSVEWLQFLIESLQNTHRRFDFIEDKKKLKEYIRLFVVPSIFKDV